MIKIRPICTVCNKNYSAINYIKDNIKHYRSHCDDCGKKKIKAKKDYLIGKRLVIKRN